MILPRNHLPDGSSVEDVYTPDRVKEAIEVFGADDPAHPSVAYLRNRVKDFYVGGKVQAIQPPAHFDYVALRCKLPALKNIYYDNRTHLLDFMIINQIHLQNCDLISKNSPGAKSSLFRRATRCIEHTAS